MKDGLTPKQKAFADYYIECGNAAEAARRAGYSEKNARKIGNENLTKLDISEYIRQRTAPTEEKRIATGDEVMEFFTKVMDGLEKDAFGLEVSISDRMAAGKELLKRRVDDRKYELELLKLESRMVETARESDDIDDTFLEALNSTAVEVWGNEDSSGIPDG